MEILKQSSYYSKQNIGLALGKEGKDLSYWIQKLLKQKMLISLKKGLYISSYYRDLVSQNPSDKELYYIYLANVLRSPSYVSLEYVLSRYNIIPESSYVITSITTKSSRTFSSEIISFVYRSIKKELFLGWENWTFKNKTIRIATKAKALFDFLYLKSFENKPAMVSYLLDMGRIQWEVLTAEDKDEFVKAVALSSSKKMQSIMTLLKDKKIL